MSLFKKMVSKKPKYNLDIDIHSIFINLPEANLLKFRICVGKLKSSTTGYFQYNHRNPETNINYTSHFRIRMYNYDDEYVTKKLKIIILWYD